MRKLTKTLTLGVAATILVAASTASYAFCPRGGYSGANYYGGNNGYYEGDYKYGYYKKTYKKKSYYKNYEKYDYKKSTPPSDENNAEEERVENNNEADNTAADNTAAEVSTQSRIFEIVDKSECKVEGCEKIVLRDPNGDEVVVTGIEFSAEMADDASAEELAYHLSENGSAVRGKLTPGDNDTFTFVIEKIYS